MISVGAQIKLIFSRPVFNPTVIFPEAGRLRAAIETGDWQAAAGFFEQFSDSDEQSFGATIVAKSKSAGKTLERAIDSTPGDSLPKILKANYLIEQGWAARTNLRAHKVSRNQFAVFHEHLRQAEQILIDITANEPRNALAWQLRLTTARGLELGQSEARRRYDLLALHHPHNLTAQRRFLQQLCPKWGGSWEAMHAFARSCVQIAPAGSPAGVLIAESHLERWLDLKRGKEATNYLRQPMVVEEIIAAAESSVLHPKYESRFGWVSDHSTFAMVFSLIGDQSRAAIHFRALGNYASEFPWMYFGDPTTVFRQNRAAAIRKG